MPSMELMEIIMLMFGYAQVVGLAGTILQQVMVVDGCWV